MLFLEVNYAYTTLFANTFRLWEILELETEKFGLHDIISGIKCLFRESDLLGFQIIKSLNGPKSRDRASGF